MVELSGTRLVPPTSDAEAGAKRGVEYAARLGYVAKGVVYGTIGLLAALTVLGFSGGRIAGTRGAIDTLHSQPFGQFILWAVVLGLFGYSLWRFVQAFLDPESKGSDAEGLAKRTGLAISGLSYTSLGIFGLTRLIGSLGSSSDSESESAATIMQFPGGRIVVAIIGAVFVIVGCYQGYRAYSISFREHWSTAEMAPAVLRWSTHLSRFGIAARSVAFLVIGGFFIQAGWQADAAEAQGLEGALQSFFEGRFGAVLLGVVAVGFICYGIYCAINARFKRINP
jgi:hypothetical protein